MSNTAYIIQKSTLTEIGDAIRSKTGGSEPIPVTSLAEEIVNLPTGGDFTDATATASDIAKGKTAYVATGKVTGTAGASIKALIDARESASYLFYAALVSKVTDVSFLSYSDTENATDFSNMFYGCSNLTELPLFNTSNGTDFSYMLKGCYGLTKVPLFDTSNGKNFSYMLQNCYGLTEVPLFNTSNGTNFSNMFYDCNKLTEVPLLDTSNGTNFSNMFYNCKALQTVPQFDTSNVTNMYSMFYQCRKLQTVPQFDTSNVTNVTSMFFGCSALENLPFMNWSNVTSASQAFHSSGFVTLPFFDMKKVTNVGGFVQACTKLKTVPELDWRSVTTTTFTFSSCSAIENILVKNIKTNLEVSNNTSHGKLLTLESLIHLIYELRDTGSSKTLTMGTTNLNKLASTYVKLVEITDDMRAEDDLIDEKLPFVVCESTDEGAMLITDYPQLKNWILK